MKIDYIANVRIPTERAHGLQIMKMCEAWGIENEVILWAPKRINHIKNDPFLFYGVKRTFRIKKIFILDFIPLVNILGRLAFWIENLSFAIAITLHFLLKRQDVIFSRDFWSAYFLSLIGKHVVYEIHDSPNKHFITYNAFKKISKFVVTNDFKAQELMNNFGVREGKILIARNGVDSKSFEVKEDKEDCRKSLGLPINKKIVMYSGHLYSWKGAHILLEVAKKIERENIVFVFVGGTNDDVIRFQSSAGFTSNILILGHKEYSKIPYYLCSADVLVLPNTAKERISLYETSPIKLFEYMASMRPIIASGIPSIKEVVTENQVVFFEPDNVDDLKEKIIKVIDESEEFKDMVQDAKNLSLFYSWDNRADEILKFILNKLLDPNKKINFLKGVSDYFNGLSREDGSIICDKDRVEHTGKNTYSVIIDCVLYQKTGKEKYFLRAKKRSLRAVENLIYNKEYDCYIFYPGSQNPRNASNSIIDGGAIIDSLCFFLKTFESKLNEDEKNKIKDAIFKHADTYLKKYCVEKDITNQRLWGATGLASAYDLFGNDEWKVAVISSIEKSFSEQNSDGSFPYYPNYKKINGHSGMSDITPYYHSRHIAFIIYALENVGESIDKYLEQLKKATDFLIAMYQVDGVKNMYLEGKRWYWNSAYEVASHPYDIYVLEKMYKLIGEKIYFSYAYKSFLKLLEHIKDDGGITSHIGKGDNWQCRIVWNSHIAWLAKIIDLVLPELETKEIEYFKNFYDAGVIKYEHKNYSFILRYKKKSMNIDWGTPVAGGELLYYGRKDNNWKNEIVLSLRGGTPMWQSRKEIPNLIVKGKNNLKQFIGDNKMAILGERWRFFVYFTSGNILGAIKRFWQEVIKKYPGYFNQYSNIWSTDSELLECNRERIRIKSHVANRRGNILEDEFVENEYKIGENKLEIIKK